MRPTRKRGATKRKPGPSLIILWASALVAAPLPALDVQLLHVETASVRESVGRSDARDAAGTVRLSVTAGLATQDLVLVPSRTLPAVAGSAMAYEGEVPLRTGSWARLTRTPAGWVGVWYDGARHYAIDRAAALSGTHPLPRLLPADTPMVFALRDALVRDADFGSDTLVMPAATLEPEPPTASAVLPTRRLSVGLIADDELVQLDGELAAPNMLARLNVIDGIFANAVGVRISSAGTTLLTAATQPFTGTTPGTLLEQLRDYRGGSSTQQAAGLSHLMTGRDLDERTVGIAYLKSLCDPRFSASLSEARSTNVNFTALIAAHEMGHVFGAPHDGEDGSACSATPDNQFLMAAQLNGSTLFSSCSLEQIQPVVARATCLAPVDAADASLGAPVESRLALDEISQLNVTVRSEGTVPVEDVRLVVDLPALLAIEVIGVEGSGASCSGAATRIECALGTLAVGASRDLRLRLRATQAGTARAQLRLTATNDGLPDNDSTSVRLIAEGGADLSTEIALSPASVEVGGLSTATIAARNLGAADAADARLSVEVPAALAINSFSATHATCQLAGGSQRVVECPATALAAGQSATLTLQLQGSSAGTSLVVATLNATRADPQPANNRSERALIVGATPQATGGGGGSGGGGGATDLLTLAALGLALARLRTYRDAAAK